MKEQTVSAQLRQFILNSGHTRYRICAEAGLEQSSISRFVHGKSSVSLEAVDALAEFLGLELKQRLSTHANATAKRAGNRRTK